MKVAVSIPDDIFADADQLAQKLKTTRSAIYTSALRQYVAQNDAQSITDRINAVVDSLSEEEQEDDLRFVRRAAYLTFQRTEW